MTTAVITRPKRGRPGKEVLPGVPAQSRAIALRNRRIKSATTRKRNPLTQEQAAEKYGVDQSRVSVIVRNPLSGVAKCDL